MKKLFYLLMVAVTTVVFIGCSKDDASIVLKQSEVSLYYGDNFQIEATPNTGLTYKSENEYHAVVSETGLVTALFVGETNIIVSDGNDSERLKVTVRPQSTLYPDPYLNWGASRSEVIAYSGTPDVNNEDGLTYKGYGSAEALIYMFDESDNLTSAGVVVKSSLSSEMSSYLAERYLPIDISSETYTISFVNGLSPESITTAIGARLVDPSYWMIAYIPYNQATSNFSLEASDQLAKKAQMLLAK